MAVYIDHHTRYINILKFYVIFIHLFVLYLKYVANKIDNGAGTKFCLNTVSDLSVCTGCNRSGANLRADETDNVGWCGMANDIYVVVTKTHAAYEKPALYTWPRKVQLSSSSENFVSSYDQRLADTDPASNFRGGGRRRFDQPF